MPKYKKQYNGQHKVLFLSDLTVVVKHKLIKDIFQLISISYFISKFRHDALSESRIRYTKTIMSC